MTFEIIFTLVVSFSVLLAFIKQVAPVELIAFFAVCSLLLFGVVETDEVLKVFENSAAITVATMFILSAALEKVGIINEIGYLVIKIAKYNPILAISLMFIIVYIASAFVNNTSVVLVLIPVIILLAKNIGIGSSKLLIPLSYVAILGGTTTLIGTSTNLLVDSVSQDLGQKPFGMFELFIPAIILSISGFLYMILIGKRFLPDNKSLSEEFNSQQNKKFISHFTINSFSPLIGKPYSFLKDIENNNLEIVDFVTDKKNKTGIINYLQNIKTKLIGKFSHAITEILISEGDDIIISATSIGLKDFVSKYGLNDNKTEAIEAIVPKNSPVVGLTISEINRNKLHGFNVLAIHRIETYYGASTKELKISEGDSILVTIDDPKLLNNYSDIIQVVSELSNVKTDKTRAIIAIFVVVLVVLSAALNIIPIAGAGLIGVAIVLISGCIKLEDAYKSLQPNVLFLIYFMLALSLGMEKSGALNLIVNGLTNFSYNIPPFVMVSILYILTSAITEVFSNNAAALMLTPIAIGIAENSGVDARPFQAAIMFGASASFATPIGYQTNTLVFNAGGYKFVDFIKIGLPMNIVLWIMASIIIPIYWGLY